MSISSLRRRAAPWARCTFAASCLGLAAAPLAGQSLTSGELVAAIVDEHGVPMRDVTVTLERGGAAFRILTTDRAGIVDVPLLAPGLYAILAEQLGFQPVRARALTVAAGSTTRTTVRLSRHPPPITGPEDVLAQATISGPEPGAIVEGNRLRQFANRTDITDVSRDLSMTQLVGDGRNGLAGPIGGLPVAWSHLVIDGVDETLLRHPGIPSEPISAPLFSRDGIQQATFSDVGLDGEWPGALGGILAAETTPGSGGRIFHPWAAVSTAKLGGRSIDNPGDSSALSVQGGLTAGGPIKGDSAAWYVTANYQQLQEPTAAPFENGGAPGEPADLAGAIRAAASAHGTQDVSAWVAPTVRTWRGGSALGRLDWRLGGASMFGARVGFASWTEDNPQLGLDAVNGAGSHLSAYDISGAAFYTTSSDDWISETRLGVRTASRDWSGASLPYTGLVGEGIAIGTSATLPGNFTETAVDLSEAFTLQSGQHQIKVGGALTDRGITDDWVPGSSGEYQFGDLASFGSGQGSYYQAVRAGAAPSLSVLDASFFGQDGWQLSPTFQLFGGFKYEYESLPGDSVANEAIWEQISDIRNTNVPTVAHGIFGPRAGVVWNADPGGRTVVRGSAGLVEGGFDIGALAEAAQYDGDVMIRRALGAVGGPTSAGPSAAIIAVPALTMFNANVRMPRTFKGDLSLVHRVDASTTVTLSGGYYHTDYLLRREDLNRIEAPVAIASDGRPIWGGLEQISGMVAPAIGSNRRFTDFDMVYGLTSTGYDDDYEAGLSVEHRVNRGLTLSVSYTYSQASDNLPGESSANPEDHLSPFPTGINGGSWDGGRSDFDIPHRVVALVQYSTGGTSPFVLSARYRLRSGLPFTPGFRAGVDANGDGSGGNDPAPLTSSIPGMTQLLAANPCLDSQAGLIAARNSCRDDMLQALDLHMALGLTRHLALTVDGFNVVATATGLFDHAAVLIDPTGSITADASGRTVLPLIANTNFGQLLSRRGEPRMLRVGVRVEN